MNELDINLNSQISERFLGNVSVGTMFIETFTLILIKSDIALILALYRNQIVLRTGPISDDPTFIVPPGQGHFDSENVILSCIYDCSNFVGDRESMGESEKIQYEKLMKETFKIFQDFQDGTVMEKEMLKNVVDKNITVLNELHQKGPSGLWGFFLAACNIISAYFLLEDLQEAKNFITQNFHKRALAFLEETKKFADDKAHKRVTACTSHDNPNSEYPYVFYYDDNPKYYTDLDKCQRYSNATIQRILSNNKSWYQDLIDALSYLKEG